MMNIPRSEINKITDQSSKPGYVKNTAVHGNYPNVVKGNTVQTRLPQKEPSGGVESMILNLIQCMSTMQIMIQDLIKAQNQLLKTC